MPWKRSWASRVCSLSRIVVFRGIEIEEVAGDLPQDERLQAGEVEQAELQGLLNGRQEGAGRIGALHLEQAAQRPQAAAMAALLQGRGITFEARVALRRPAQPCLP